MVAPITLSNDIWTNEVNAYREWEWEGSEPLNHRLMRFINLIELQNDITVAFAGKNPTDLYHKIQQKGLRYDNPDEYIMIMYQYSTSLSL